MNTVQQPQTGPVERARVMIVEDEAIVAMELEARLQELGYHVAGVSSDGESVTDLAVSSGADLVLMDIRLEGEMDGIQAAEHLRSLVDVPVLFLTAFSDSATLERVKATEPYALLTKPVDGRRLETAIEIALHKHRTLRQSARRQGEILAAEVDDRRRVELALHASEERLGTLARAVPIGIFRTCTDGRCIFVNDEWCHITGMSESEWLGCHWTESLPEEKKHEALEALSCSEGEGGFYRLEFPVSRPDGQTRWVSQRMVADRATDGRFLGYLGCMADITPRRDAEIELRKAHAQLEQRVSERTAELEEMNRSLAQEVIDRKQAERRYRDLSAELEQRVAERTEELRASQDELVRSERLATLGRLTATVSHELRNPLATMRASLHVARKRSEDDDRLTAALDRIARSVTRCDRIIEELLDYTRREVVNLERIPFGEWLAELLDELEVPEGITLLRDLGPPDLEAEIDPERLRRAVINIFDNACQAMQPGDGVVAPERSDLAVTVRAADDCLALEISDTGVGIPAESLPKIFEPLFSTKAIGIGLGLSVVKQVLAQHRGEVEVESQEGVGTVVRLQLPLPQRGA